MKNYIESGKAILGIEFGSTRIKAVLVNDEGDVLAVGGYDWENSLKNASPRLPPSRRRAAVFFSFIPFYTMCVQRHSIWYKVVSSSVAPPGARRLCHKTV